MNGLNIEPAEHQNIGAVIVLLDAVELVHLLRKVACANTFSCAAKITRCQWCKLCILKSIGLFSIILNDLWNENQ